jgi:hypothetical protein
MIKMSRIVGVRAVVLAAMGVVAGCCGSGPTHRCDFTPPTQPARDAGPDGALPCGTQVCASNQVCCIKKVPLVALCIDPSQFVANMCEKLDLPCTVPADCPTGLVCCVQLSPLPGVTCLPPQLCPGDGTNTFLACEDASQCPGLGTSCTEVGSFEDTILKVCTPIAASAAR